MEKEELARKLKSVALLEGDFTLRSGRRSHYYFDKYRFETRPELLRAVAKELAAMLARASLGREPPVILCLP